MIVRDIMSKAHVVDKSTRVSEALDIMDKQHVRRLVVKRGKDVEGVITLGGICKELGSRRKHNHPPSLFHVVDALSESYGILAPDDDVKKAVDMLKDVDCAVVVDGGVCGEVRTSDVLKHIVPDGAVSGIMNAPIVATPDARVSHIRKLMMDTGVSRVPIMEGKTLIGMVSESDIARAFRGVKRRSPQNHQDNKVESLLAMDIMSVNVITVKPEATLKEAANVMLENDVGALPVVDDMKHIVGLVTRRDIIKAI